ncbi:class I adenylate-forming enzyme family protein [Glycomyces halotolerans]
MERTPGTGPATTAPQLLRQRAAEEADRVPLTGPDGRGLSYGEWEARASRVAAGCSAAGYRPGDVIGLRFDESAWGDYAIAYMAVLKLGAVALHLSPRLDPTELRRRVRQCDAALMLRSPGPAPVLDRVRQATVAEMEADTDGPFLVRVNRSAPAEILYTSGTTGPAKPIANPHENLAHGHRRAAGRVFDASRAMLAPMPVCTPSSASLVGMFALVTGSPLIVPSPDDMDGIRAALDTGAVGSLMVTPWTARRITETYRGPNPAVASIGIASAPLPPAFARRLAEVFPNASVNTAYAQNEVVPAVVLGQYDPDRPLALGRPGPGTEVAVRDPRGDQCPPGTVGEIWMRHTDVRRRWHWGRTPPAGPGEWVGTGDWGHFDDEGTLHLFDRGGDRIPTSRGPVSSIAVENELYADPSVREAAVVHDRGRITAVLAGPVHDLDRVEKRLREGPLAGVDEPIDVVVLGELPRGITGKVLKARLRNRSRAHL